MIACLVVSPRAAFAQDNVSAPDSASASGDEQGSASFAPAPPGSTNTVLPRVGIDGQLPDLRDRLLSAFGTPPAREAAGSLPRSGLRITKQVTVSEEFTTNAGRGTGRSGNGQDFITLIQPDVSISDETQRFQIGLNYAPTAEIYAENGDFTQLRQQASGTIVVIAVPDWFYVDMRGSVSEQSVYGGLDGGGFSTTTSTLAPNNREMLSSVSVSPYVTHGFGGTGTAQIGAAYIYSATDAPDTAQSGGPPFGFGGGNYGSSYLGTERVFASFETGDDFGRVRDRIGTDANFYTGSGVLRSARRVTVTDDASYAVTRLIALLGEVGYEDLAYPASDFAYSGVIGAAGVRLTPSRGSALVVQYRYLDGFGAAFVQGSVQVTARIRVFGDYSEGISTQQQDQQNSLLDGADFAGGAPGLATVASPLLGNGGGFGANQDLHRLRRLDANFAWFGDRDTLTLSVQREKTTPIGRSLPGVLNAPTSTIFGSLTWRREIFAATSLSANLRYGSNQTALRLGQGQLASQDTISFSLGIDHAFNDLLSAYARVEGTEVLSGYDNLGGQDGSQTDVVIGVIKRF